MTRKIGDDIVSFETISIDGQDFYVSPADLPTGDEIDAFFSLEKSFKQKDASCFESIKLSKEDLANLCEVSSLPSLDSGDSLVSNVQVTPESCEDVTEKVQEAIDSMTTILQDYQTNMERFPRLELEFFYLGMVNAYYDTFLIKYEEYSNAVTKIVEQLDSLSNDNSTLADLKRERLNLGLDRILSFGDKRVKSLDDFISKFREYRRRSVRASNDISNQVDPKYDDKIYYKLFVDYNSDIRRGYLDDLYDFENDLVEDMDKEDPDFMEEYRSRTESYRNTTFYPKHDETIQAIEDAADKLARFASALNLDPNIVDGFDIDEFTTYANERVSDYENARIQYESVLNIQSTITELTDDLKLQLADVCTKQKVDGDDSIEAGQDLNFNGMPDFTLPQADSLKYWQKFAAFASVANLLPIHWSVGLLLPSPSGVVKVKLPTIWIALAVVPLPGRMLVVFLGICGVVPSPFVWEWRFPPSGEGSSHFLLSWRKFDWKIKDKTGTETFPLPIFDGQDIAPPVSRTKLFTKDDIPPWERLSPANPLFLLYLNRFVSKGKEGAGFP